MFVQKNYFYIEEFAHLSLKGVKVYQLLPCEEKATSWYCWDSSTNRKIQFDYEFDVALLRTAEFTTDEMIDCYGALEKDDDTYITVGIHPSYKAEDNPLLNCYFSKVE